MEDLLKAIAIFLKYGNVPYPFNCTHDQLVVWGYTPSDFSEEDRTALSELGFDVTDEFGEDTFYSFKYGSC